MNIQPSGKKTPTNSHEVMRRISYFGIFVKNQDVCFWFSQTIGSNYLWKNIWKPQKFVFLPTTSHWRWNMSLAFILLYYFSINDMYFRKRRKKSFMSHITRGSFSTGIREIGGICWDLLAQGVVTLDLTVVMLWLLLGIVRAAFSSAWNWTFMDAERQEHFKLFSERPFSAASPQVFWDFFL